ncbi:MAG: type IV pilin-like G/H family protein [Leptolyngbya sp. SIO1E4]|nr:type IV pilin-like G/H family protein [Leptolyngbya sp. SIO1E4]
MSQSALLTVSVLTAFALGLMGCVPNLNESDNGAAPLRASPETKIVPLEDEVAEYPQAFEAKAQQTLNILQRAQQSHYLERRRFAASVEALSIGLEMADDAYTYTIEAGEVPHLITMTAAPKFDPLHSYTAAVAVSATGDRLETLTCESENPAPYPPTISGSGTEMSCSPGAQPLK